MSFTTNLDKTIIKELFTTDLDCTLKNCDKFTYLVPIAVSETMRKVGKTNNKNEEKNDEGEKNEENVDYWEEFFSAIFRLGLVLLTYCILLYLLSYSKNECPLSPL